VDPRRLEEIPERIVGMMGYRMHRQFIGYADGLAPRRAAERMVERLGKELEKEVETFARRGSKL